MAVIRREIPASTQDLFARQWLFTIVEGMAQEMDAGRLVYIAQATGKRMTRDESGKFVGLDGSAVTEADLAVGVLTPTNQVRRLEMTISFEGDDEPARVSNLREAIGGTKFNKVKAALKMLSDIAMAEKAAAMDDSTVVDGEESPLDKM